MSKRFLITLVTVLIIGIAAGIAIFLAKGYTFSTDQNKIVGTGIITVTSTPDAASVYVDGHLTTATNATISSLSPKKYSVRIVKEGFIPWERDVTVSEGLVSALKVTLFPAIPTVYPLTFTGVKNAVLSPDGGKLAYVVPNATNSAQLNSSTQKKAGVWVWTLVSDQPISFARGSEPHQIAQNVSTDYSKATLKWSPDSKQVLATIGNNNFLLDSDNLNSDPRDITPTLQSTLNTWTDDQQTKDSARVLTIKDLNVRKIASSAGVLKWSPDETKFMYGSKPDAKVATGASELVKVYDVVGNTQYDLPPAKSHFWLPDSRHVVLVEDNQVSIADFDGTNKAVIYAGNFDSNSVFAWPDSSKLVVISSFPTPTASEPNFYGINLK